MREVCILATGGTIDKEHDPISETLVFSEKSHVVDILRQCRAEDIKHHVIMLKDSLDLTDEDREVIKNKILERSEAGIVVTHGTSTMALTAEYIQRHVKNKTVVLTGAMRPFTLFLSDASFNLGGAIAAARIAEPGVYIYMNGKIFDAGTVEKDKKSGIFVHK